MLQELLEGIRSLVFPNHCAICRKGPLPHPQVVCPLCYATLPIINSTTTPNPIQGVLTSSHSVCRYQEPLIKLIHQFKYQQSTRLARLFNQLLIDYLNQHRLIEDIDCIIPIPMHPAKLRDRGFNQSELLANAISLHFNKPIITNLLIRSRQTETQTHLSAKERWTNQEGTFRITQSKNVSHRRILIVDDLTTSGATAHNAAFTLKQHGAYEVHLLTLVTT